MESNKGKGNGIAPFVQALADMVNSPDFHCIHWSDDGKKFVIENVDEFCQQVLPHFFCHKSMPSFARQLNYHDFYKCVDGEETTSLRATSVTPKKRKKNKPTRLVYAHPFFLKGNPELLPYITRRTNRKASTALVAQRQAKEHTLQTEQNGSHNATRALKTARQIERESAGAAATQQNSPKKAKTRVPKKFPPQEDITHNHLTTQLGSSGGDAYRSYPRKRFAADGLEDSTLLPQRENSYLSMGGSFQPTSSGTYQQSYGNQPNESLHRDYDYGRTPFSMSEYPPALNNFGGNAFAETAARTEVAEHENAIPELGATVSNSLSGEAVRANSMPFDNSEFQFPENSFPPNLEAQDSLNQQPLDAKYSASITSKDGIGDNTGALSTAQSSLLRTSSLDAVPKGAQPSDSDLSQEATRFAQYGDNSAELEAAFMLRGMSWGAYDGWEKSTNQT